MENKKMCECHCHGWGKRIVVVLLSVALLTLALFLTFQARNSWRAHDYIGKSDQVQNVITVSGEGKVTAVPDIAKVSIGLTTEKKTVAEAQDENNTKMNEIIAAIKDLDIAEKDLKTSSYFINPKYDWTNGNSRIVGYTVEQHITVKIRDTKKINDVLSVAGESGATNIGSLVFENDDPQSLRADARDKAIANAKEKADLLAQKLGVKLGRVTSFYESDGYSPSPIYANYRDLKMDSGVAAESLQAPDIQTGENDIVINVAITYEIL